MQRAHRMGQIRWCQEDFSGKRDKARRMQRRSGVCMSSCVCARSEEGALFNEWAGCSGAADTDGYIIQQERFPQEQWKTGKVFDYTVLRRNGVEAYGFVILP